MVAVLFILEAWSLAPNGLAVREESVGHDLGCLPPRCIDKRPEVGQVTRWQAWLAGLAARISADVATGGERVGVGVENAARRNVFKLLPGWRVMVAGCVCIYLGDLPPGGVAVGPEVGQVTRWHAWLAGPAARISAHIPTGGKPANVLEERRANRYVLEPLGGLVVREARCVGHYLGKLAPRYGIVGLERAIRVTADDAKTCQAVNIWVESAAHRHVGECDSASCGSSWYRRGRWSHGCACGW
jgi:hypothetical protein